MSRAPSTSPELLDAARALMAPPEELGVREAARRLGVSKSALARALSTSKAPQKPQAAPAPRKAPPQPPKPAGAPQAPQRAAYTPPAPAPRLPAPPPAKLAADPLDELQRYAEEVRGRQAGLPAGSAEFRSLGTELRGVIKDMEAIRRKRPPTETAEGRAALARPIADSALAKIRAGVTAVAQREAETGTCCRCSAPLAAELVARRRVEAGMEGAA